jgi:hypothetical protein
VITKLIIANFPTNQPSRKTLAVTRFKHYPKMRNLINVILILAAHYSFGQPNPQESYPKRIKEITEQLKTDSLNYKLIWDRLEMKVNLLGGFGTLDDIFLLKSDSADKIKKREINFSEYNTDFIKIHDNIIKLKKFDVIEEGDFYLNRIWLYFKANEIEKAIEDAKYLRDSASYSRYSERGEYYNKWAIYSLFNLYVLTNQYNEALGAIDTLLEKKKSENPEVYYSGHGSFLSYNDKIRLFEHFNDQNKIIPFLRENCIDHFNWYFENAKSKDYYTNSAKDQSFELLKLTIEYMRKYGDTQIPKYEKIYDKLRYHMNENYECINPTISDKKLKSIVSEI